MPLVEFAVVRSGLAGALYCNLVYIEALAPSEEQMYMGSDAYYFITLKSALDYLVEKGRVIKNERTVVWTL